MRNGLFVLMLGVLLMTGGAMADTQVGPPPPDEMAMSADAPPPPPPPPPQDGGKGHKFPGPEKMIEKMAKDLELTDQQKEKFIADANRVEENAKAVRETNKLLFDKVQAEVSSDNPDMKKVASYIQEISKNDSQVHLMRIERIVELRKSLSPEQKAKFDAIIKQKNNGKRKH